jgi:MYXO-CTERM domain-containing protein
MSRRFAFAFLGVAPLAILAPKIAHAGIESCGNINVKANAQCKVEVEGGCTAKCEPVSFTAACQGKATAKCDGQCTATIDAECSTSCTADCNTKCTANPGSYDCSGQCSGSCSADCDAECAAQASGGTASANCKASCQGNCDAKCSAQCSGTPPSASCEGKCSASCKGRCEAKASAKCQIQCRTEFQGSCQAELKGGCEARCKDPKGALFCDGQFVDTGNNLENCIAALNAILNIKVDASASAECSGNQCTGEASVKASACSTSPEPAHAPPVLPGVILAGAVGAAVARKRRRGGS